MSGGDKHVTIVSYYSVPTKRMKDFEGIFADFYTKTKAGTRKTLYFGFCLEEPNQSRSITESISQVFSPYTGVFCREGFTTAAGALAHIDDVKEPFAKAMEIVGPRGLDLSFVGPRMELEVIKERFPDAQYYELDEGSMWLQGLQSVLDTHVTIVPYFTVPLGRMPEFKREFGEFYNRVRSGTPETLYYGFAVDAKNGVVLCREGYKSADGAVAHIKDVQASLDKAMGIASNLNLAVMGPFSEIQKLKPAFSPLGAKFWVTDADSMWFPGVLDMLKMIPRICCGT